MKQKSKSEKKIQAIFGSGAYHEARKSLNRNGYRVASLEDAVNLRLQEGDESPFFKAHLVKTAGVHVPGKGFYITNKPLVIENDLNGGDLTAWVNLTDEQVEQVLADSVHVCHGDNPYSIRTSRLGDELVTRYAFGDSADRYGLLLEALGVPNLIILPIRSESPNNCMSQLTFEGFINDSTFRSSSSHLECTGQLRPYPTLGIKRTISDKLFGKF